MLYKEVFKNKTISVIYVLGTEAAASSFYAVVCPILYNDVIKNKTRSLKYLLASETSAAPSAVAVCTIL